MRLGMFDPPNDTSYHFLSPDDVNTADNQVRSYCYVITSYANVQDLALKLAQESIVLLQNNKSEPSISKFKMFCKYLWHL